MKLSSSLFKRATAAEIFLNNMEKFKKQNHIKAKKDKRDIIKVNNQAKVPKSNIQQLISENSDINNNERRRKSVEVLMTDLSSLANKHTTLEKKATVISSFKNLNVNSKGSKKSKESNQMGDLNRSDEMDRSFKSEYCILID